MGHTMSLSGDFVVIYQAMQRQQDRTDGLHRVGGWIHSDDCVSAAVKQSFESSEKNSADVVGGMIGLRADAQYSALSHRVAAAGHVADLGGGQHQILVAHQLGYGGGYFGDDGLLQRLNLRVRGAVVQQEVAKLSHRHAGYATKSLLVECIENQAGDFVTVGIDEGAADNFVEGQVRELAFGRDSLPFGARG